MSEGILQIILITLVANLVNFCKDLRMLIYFFIRKINCPLCFLFTGFEPSLSIIVEDLRFFDYNDLKAHAQHPEQNIIQRQ